MLNPIFWKKVQGQKHPGRWEIAEPKIPSVKMLFKTNANGHNHPTIRYIIIEQDTIGETKENNEWHSTQEPHTPPNSPIDCGEVQLHQYWTTLPVYVSYDQNSYKECIRVDKYISTQSFWTETKVIGGNTSSNPQVSALIPRPVINRMERMCQCHGSITYESRITYVQ